MRNYLSYIGILSVTFLNVTGSVGCARGREPEIPRPIASQTIAVPSPTPSDTEKAQADLSAAWSTYWRTQWARAKASACKP